MCYPQRVNKDKKMPTDMNAERRAELRAFLNRFADGVMLTAADTLTTETAYKLLQGLTYEEWNGVIRTVLIGKIGRLN
jgi:hypothetical protein